MDRTYHSGELSVQRRAGQTDRARHTARTVRAELPGVAVEFLARQASLVIGAADAQGRMWATALTGSPGFVQADHPAQVTIDAFPSPSDPLRAAFETSDTIPVGMLAIEPASRRRMRLNGRAQQGGSARGRTLTVALRQIYANCPKYIQQREAERTSAPPGQPIRSHSLSPAQRQLVESADTFFVATADRATDSPYAPAHADLSHRGGNPGFVECPTDSRLRWPDYPGNSMFGTLGNIAVNPSVGLLFLDWSTGTTLQLTGHATIDWHEDGQLPDAERSVVFDLTECVEIPQHSPLRWTAPTYSRHNPPVHLIDNAVRDL